MYTLAFFLSFLGFFCLYNVSRKATLSRTGRIEKWMQSNTSSSRIAGIVLIIASFTIFIAKDGWGPGMLAAILLVMAAGCMVVILAPLYYIKISHIALLTCLSLFTKLIIF